MQVYDERAGHYNNVEKMAITSTDGTVRKELATLNINTDDKPIFPRVFTIETLLGDYISVPRRPARKKSDQRIMFSLDSAKRVGICPGSEALRARGIATGTIPRIIQGAIWTCPSNSSIQRVRSAIFTDLWSRYRSMRCSEVLLLTRHGSTHGAQLYSDAFLSQGA